MSAEDLIRHAYQAGRAYGAQEAIEEAAKLPSVEADIAFRDDMYGWLDDNALGEYGTEGADRTLTEDQAVKKFLRSRA